ncbi:MAG TPA: hypothetical protein VMU54_01545 [Planctomycetota bacterium]|nr:hypothetical protein [Planctomycetota bacterium]
MNRFLSLPLLTVAATLSLAQAQDKKSANLPTACEIRAYYLDKEGKPADVSGVKADVLFETQDGRSRTYPMTLIRPDPEKPSDVPRCRHLTIEGTPYKLAIGAFCTDASAPGGHTHYAKPFLRPLPVVIEPDPKQEPDKRDAALSNAPYFRIYLNEQTISELASVPYTNASIRFTTRGDVRTVLCFTCSGGTPGTPCDRVSDELSTLERQIQASDLDGARGTMTRIRDAMEEIPATPENETARKEAAICCKDLDSAVQSGNRDTALARIRKLRERCEKCGECIDPQEKDSKREPEK